MNVHAFSNVDFLLKRAEVSYEQLSAYQRLSKDLLEYILEEKKASFSANGRSVEDDLTSLLGLYTFEMALLDDVGADASNKDERERIARIKSLVDQILKPSSSEIAASAVTTYFAQLKPLLAVAVSGEENEVKNVETAMRDLQHRIGWFVRFSVILQIAVVSVLLTLIVGFVLKPISRLVHDIGEFGRDRFGHRVDVRRHDEFGLLAQHINRMARRVERGRQKLIAINLQLEDKVAERTKALKASNDDLREIDESRRRFFADVSHELRTPLTAIVGEADVTLRMASPDTTICREALAAILANASFLNRRIDDLIALARSSDGRLDLYRQALDINLVAADALSEIQSLANLNGVEVNMSFHGAPIIVDGDRQKLRQALTILLDNAVKFTRATHGIELLVDDLVEPGGSWATIIVTDHGRGIADEDLPYVFERYYQTDVGRRMGGTGLGLAIARRIVEAHKGRIAASRGTDGGTVVTIKIPRSQPGP